MWHDNETSTDLVGFGRLADTVCYLVSRDDLRPLTVGVFGDWGSGKSSLLRMAHERVDADAGYVSVWFSPWLHKDYDDVKAALMVAVLSTLKSKRPITAKVEGAIKDSTLELWNRLARRVDWFRLFGFAAKNVIGTVAAASGHHEGLLLNASSLGDLGQLYQPSAEPEGTPRDGEAKGDDKIIRDAEPGDGERNTPFEQSIDEFRSDFELLLSSINIKSLVVFIDDIDRCLPPAIVDIFEALKLFLSVPKTNFVIAADERVIRHAIETRYPDTSAYATRIGRDYLEKIIQIPVYIPPLTSAETETYLNLLTLEQNLGTKSPDFATIVKTANTVREESTLDVAMNYGIAKTSLPALDEATERAMQLVQQLAPILCTQLEGNPRRIKRFVNTLHLRLHIASSRGVALDVAILAKLMVLEYFFEAFFTMVFQWQTDGDGVAAPLTEIEDAIRTGDLERIDKFFADIKLSGIRDGIRSCLNVGPNLAGINLSSYFYFSRDRVTGITGLTSRMSQKLQEVLARLQSDKDAERALGVENTTNLTSDELATVYRHLTKAFTETPSNSALEQSVVQVVSRHRQLVPALVDALASIPPAGLRSSLPLIIASELKPLPAQLEQVITTWAGAGRTPLSLAAKKALGLS